MPALFHLAYHVLDLDASRAFYCGALGCTAGRSTSTWVDIDFFGQQLSLHLGEPFAVSDTGRVAGQVVPMPHLGVILSMDESMALAARLEARHDIAFDLKPQIRFAGQPGDQATMFFRDPSGNPIEVKGFSDLTEVYAQ